MPDMLALAAFAAEQTDIGRFDGSVEEWDVEYALSTFGWIVQIKLANG